MDWEKFWQHLPYWFVTLVLFAMLTVGYTAPKVSQAINAVQGISTPQIQYTETPLVHSGCSALDLSLGWVSGVKK